MAFAGEPLAPAPLDVELGEPQGGGKFFQWLDTSFSYLPYGWNYEVDPSEQTALTLEHAHASSIGDMFLFFDLYYYHGIDSGDDWSWYGEVSPRLSFGKIFEKDLSFQTFGRSLFEVKDVLLAGQYERGKEADEAEAVLIGLGFDLDVRKAGLLGPLGKFDFIQLNFYARNELAESAESGFRDMQITMSAAYPITVGNTRFLLDGYFDYVLGIGPEEPSFHFNPQVKLDLGNYWGKPEKLYVGVELDFWWQKYQIPDSAALDSNQAAVSLLLKYHF